MLVALETSSGRPLNLPDFDGPLQIEDIRERTRAGEFICPQCRTLLWLRAGEVRIPYFAHRSRSTCPQTHVSAVVLLARQLLYRFFRERFPVRDHIDPISLEPIIPGLPPKTRVDLLLTRPDLPSVAISLIEAGVPPLARDALQVHLQTLGYVHRPIFLASRLEPQETAEGTCYNLDTTQREWCHQASFGFAESFSGKNPSLHFIDPEQQTLRSLRGLFQIHRPQLYSAAAARVSPLGDLRWHNGSADWVHPDEPKTAKYQRPSSPAITPPTSHVPTPHSSPQRPPRSTRPEPKPKTTPPPPDWGLAAYRCIGCSQQTPEWQNMRAAEAICVCKVCFKQGVRLP